MKNITLPPPAWAFGHHITLPSDLKASNLSEFLDVIKLVTKFPMEGLYLEKGDLEKEVSYTLDSTRFGRGSLSYLKAQNLTIMGVSRSGYSLEDPIFNRSKFINDSGIYVKTLHGGKYTGLDINGKVIYIDYSMNDSAVLVGQQMDEFSKAIGGVKYGVSLKSNEVSKQFCTAESCYTEYHHLPERSWFIQKPGNIEMSLDTF